MVIMARGDYGAGTQAALLLSGAYPFVAIGETISDTREAKVEVIEAEAKGQERKDKSKTKRSKSKAADREKNAESGLVEAEAESQNAESYAERIEADRKLAAAHVELEEAREESALAGAEGTRAQTVQWALIIGGVLAAGGLGVWRWGKRK